MANIIALIDGSTYTASVVDNAAFAAEKLGEAVNLVHVIGRRDFDSAPADLSGNLDLGEREELLKELADLDERKAKLARKRGRHVLDDAAARLRSGSGDIVVKDELVLGDLLETIEAREGDADLVVIGKRGEAADFAQLHLGSNLERVLRRTKRPVLVAARSFRPIRRFLIAYDGGASIAKAIDWLQTSPFLKGCPCELVCVSDRKTHTELDHATEMLRHAGYDATSRLIAGEPDEIIEKEAEREDIDLVVMGAYGHSRIRSFLIGSTTSEIVRGCYRPVLLFR
ncbi:MAG: universal stress protein [Fulvimarina manganoxydans]|uniref:universal stress protein n=1 Tax=Fulvimarina manganoxydans TaxID=937218 RepID=UPI002354A797|nr:universal stress protein [Fulvimarina manganoxydans]MCK5931821.1 universal stress protein [Fulvimarina manganoxydans]